MTARWDQEGGQNTQLVVFVWPLTGTLINVKTTKCRYSRLSNKRDGWNKRDGRKILQNFGPKIHYPPTNFKFKCIFGYF